MKPATVSRTCAAPSGSRVRPGPHSGDCQFYVNVADNADLDPLPTRWGYAVFGRVVEGMEVVDRISISPTGAAGPFKQDAPLQQIVIQKVEMLAEQPAAAPAPATAPRPAPAATAPAAPATPAGETPPPPAEGTQSPAGKPTTPPTQVRHRRSECFRAHAARFRPASRRRGPLGHRRVSCVPRRASALRGCALSARRPVRSLGRRRR